MTRCDRRKRRTGRDGSQLLLGHRRHRIKRVAYCPSYRRARPRSNDNSWQPHVLRFRTQHRPDVRTSPTRWVPVSTDVGMTSWWAFTVVVRWDATVYKYICVRARAYNGGSDGNGLRAWRGHDARGRVGDGFIKKPVRPSDRFPSRGHGEQKVYRV